jgi:hypothetical protein
VAPNKGSFEAFELRGERGSKSGRSRPGNQHVAGDGLGAQPWVSVLGLAGKEIRKVEDFLIRHARQHIGH